MVCGVLGKFRQQSPRRLRNRGFAVQDFPAGNIGAVHGFVSAVVGLHDGAIHAGPGKNPFAARLALDLRIELYVRAGGCLSPHGPGRHGGVGADLEFVAHQALQCMVVHK